MRRSAYGVGLAYRSFFHSGILKHRNSIDFLEIPTIDYIERSRRILMDPSGAYLRELTAHFPCLAHGINLSIGSVEPVAFDVLKTTGQVIDEFGLCEFSDHLTFHRMAERDLTVFMSMPFDDLAARWMASQYNRAKSFLGRPFGLEIVAYSFPVAVSEMSEVQFINRVAEYTDCWFLLDVANLYINSVNHNYDPIRFLEELDGKRVLQIHIAGGHQEGGEWLDSHSQPVQEEVFELLDYALQRTAARAIILERDDKPTSFDSILNDLHRAKEIFLRHRPLQPPPDTTEEAAAAFRPSHDLPDLSLDALPPELVGLSKYQEALIHSAFELADGKCDGRSSGEIIDSYEMPQEWKSRWRRMDWDAMLRLKGKIRYVQDYQEEALRDYQRAELSQWANRIAPNQLLSG